MRIALALCMAVAVCAPGIVTPFMLLYTMHDGLLEPAFHNGVGPRVATHGLGAVGNFPYSSPYEDLKLKAK